MKLGAYLMMLVGMMIFLELVGISTGIGQTLGVFGININSQNGQVTSADIENSSFWDTLFGNAGILVLLAAGGAVIIGLFAKSYDTSLVILPFVIAVGGWFISTFWIIINYVVQLNETWMTSLVATIFGVLAIGFVMALVDYFSGR